MPTDHKRLNAPENTSPYQYYTETKKGALKIENGKREDGRSFNQHRKICNYLFFSQMFLR